MHKHTGRKSANIIQKFCEFCMYKSGFICYNVITKTGEDKIMTKKMPIYMNAETGEIVSGLYDDFTAHDVAVDWYRAGVDVIIMTETDDGEFVTRLVWEH